MNKYYFILCSVLWGTFNAHAASHKTSTEDSSNSFIQSYAEMVNQAQLSEVASTLTEAQIQQVLLSDTVKQIVAAFPENPMIELQSATLLKQLDCIDVAEPLKSTSLSACIDLPPSTLLHSDIAKEITSPLNSLLRNNLIQGYNIKRNNIQAQNNTLLYGHSSLIHAKQLVALLKLHKVNFTWQLIEKTSAFNIRDGWNDTTEVEKAEKIRYAQEYDLLLTFEDHQNKLKFMPLVSQYAKRSEQSSEQDKQTLIIDAWWQPFYRSFIDEENYKQVTRINMISATHTASTLTLNDGKEEVLTQIKSLLDEHSTRFTISTEYIWVNPAFYRYLNGKYQ